MEDSVPAVDDNFTIPEVIDPEVVAAAQEQAQQQIQQTQQQASGADLSGVGEIVGGAADVASSVGSSDIEVSGDVIGEFFGGAAEATGGAFEFFGNLLGGF